MNSEFNMAYGNGTYFRFGTYHSHLSDVLDHFVHSYVKLKRLPQNMGQLREIHLGVSLHM